VNKFKNWWEQNRDIVINFAMISLAAVTTTFVYLFQREVMPDGRIGDVIAGASAVSLVLIYVGLSVAKLDTARRKRVFWVAAMAAAIEVLYGTIHVATELYKKSHPGAPGLLADITPFWAWVLASLHAAPFSILLFLVTIFVFHDPAKDRDILKQLKEAMAKSADMALEITGLKTALTDAQNMVALLRGDNDILHKLQVKNREEWDGERKGILDRLGELTDAEQDLTHQKQMTELAVRKFEELSQELERASYMQESASELSAEIEQLSQARRDDQNTWATEKLLLQAKIESLTSENANLSTLLESASNSVTAQNGNGHSAGYTDQVALILSEEPDLTNAELARRLPDIPEGSLKTIATRVRAKMKARELN
jgi:hypothetical protein